MSRALGKIQRWRAIERILVDSSAGLTGAELARRLEVNRSTISRDMDALQDELPIYQEVDGRWRINRENYSLRIPLNVHQGMALHLATRLMATQSDRHNPHATTAVRAMAEVFKDFAPLISRHLKRSAQLMDTRRSQADQDWLRALETLTSAWSSGTAVRLRYESGRGLKEWVFEPYFIEPYAAGRSTYVIGWAPAIRELRTFKIERIRSVELCSDDHYEIPRSFDPSEMLGSAWGIWSSEEPPETVVLAFESGAAARVRETRWHASEQVCEMEDGRLEWRAEVANWIEMLPWIRGWGPDVEVLAPADLRAEVAAGARELVGRYGLG